jgi:hypothetical protein
MLEAAEPRPAGVVAHVPGKFEKACFEFAAHIRAVAAVLAVELRDVQADRLELARYRRPRVRFAGELAILAVGEREQLDTIAHEVSGLRAKRIGTRTGEFPPDGLMVDLRSIDRVAPGRLSSRKYREMLVGVTGFEPATPTSRT